MRCRHCGNSTENGWVLCSDCAGRVGECVFCGTSSGRDIVCYICTDTYNACVACAVNERYPNSLSCKDCMVAKFGSCSCGEPFDYKGICCARCGA